MPLYYLSVLAIFRNESHIMKEWIQHYIMEGVDHFYLINNFSTDDYFSVLKEFSHCVSVYDSVTPNDLLIDAQTNNYKTVFDSYIIGNTEWLIVVDLDEFMYSKKLNLKNELQILSHFNPDVGSIRVSWKIFGSNGYIEQPKSVVKHFTKRATHMEALIKNIFKPYGIESFDLHHVTMKECYKQISVPGYPVTSYSIGQSEEDLKNSTIHLNHYRLQSRDYWTKSKMKCGDFNKENSELYLNIQYFDNLDNRTNEVIDDELYKKHRVLYDTIDERVLPEIQDQRDDKK